MIIYIYISELNVDVKFTTWSEHRKKKFLKSFILFFYIDWKLVDIILIQFIILNFKTKLKSQIIHLIKKMTI